MKLLTVALLLCHMSWAQHNGDLQTFARDYFSWRAKMQPATGDDLLRIERPRGWTPDYSPAGLRRYHRDYQDFRRRLDAIIPLTTWSRSDSVDYLLLHSAIERVNWELNVLKLPYRNPDF